MTAKRLIVFGLLALVLVGSAAIYIRALYAPMILDDLSQMALASSWSSAAKILGPDCYGFFRPVKNVIFFLLARHAAGLPMIGHALSLGLFLVTVILSFLYFRRVLGSDGLGLAAAGLWALAPTQVAVVIWLSCANQLVMMCAVFGALLFHERAQAVGSATRPWWWGGAALCSLLAMASYEIAVVLPALAVLHDVWMDAHRLAKARNRAGYMLLSGVAASFVAARFMLGNRTLSGNPLFASMSKTELMFSSAYFLADHLGMWLWPFGRQGILRSFDVRQEGMMLAVASAWLVVAAVVLGGIHMRKKAPWFGWAMIWFSVSMFPVSNIVPLFVGPFGDYYLPLASVGLAMAVVAGTRQLRDVACGRGWLRKMAVLPIAGVLAWGGWRVVETAGWVLTWNSEEALFRRTLENYPDAHSVRGNLARLLSQQGLVDEAVREANKVIAAAPWQTHAYYSLADALLRAGRLDESMEILRRVHDVAPAEVYPALMAGFVQEQMGDMAAAERFYREALRLPWNAEQSPNVALNLGRMLAVSGRLDEAIDVWLDASSRGPPNGIVQRNLAVAYARKGMAGMARKHAAMAGDLGEPLDSLLLESMLSVRTQAGVEADKGVVTQRVCQVRLSASGAVTVDDRPVGEEELDPLLEAIRARADAILFATEVPTNTPVFEKVVRTGLPVMMRAADGALRAGTEAGGQELQDVSFRDVPVSKLVEYYASVAGSQVLSPVGLEARVSLSLDDATRDEVLTAIEVELSRHNIAVSHGSDNSIQVRWKKDW